MSFRDRVRHFSNHFRSQSDVQRLFDAIPPDGSPRTGPNLRIATGLVDDAYKKAADELVASGLVARGRGRGGTLRRQAAGQAPRATDARGPGGNFAKDSVRSGAWIFQCPESSYAEWVRSRPKGNVYRISRHKTEIDVGDQVFVWVSGKNAGIRAITTTNTPVGATSPEGLYVDANFRQSGEHPWVGLGPLTFLDEPLTRTQAKEEERLKDMTILRAPMGSIFKLSPDERARIEELLSENGLPAKSTLGAQPPRRAPANGFESCPIDTELASRIGALLAKAHPGAVTHESVARPGRGELLLLEDTLPSGSLFVRPSSAGGLEWGARVSGDEAARAGRWLSKYLDEVWTHLGDLPPELRWTAHARRGAAPVRLNKEALPGWISDSRPEVLTEPSRWQAISSNADEIQADAIAGDLARLACLCSCEPGGMPMFFLTRPATVFVSYAHECREFVKQLTGQLSDYYAGNLALLWDRNFRSDDGWKRQIESWMADCESAIVVVSAGVFDPERWMAQVELPALLDRRDRDGLAICGVLAEELDQRGQASVFAELERYQIQLVDASGSRGQPVFDIGKRKWVAALHEGLREGAGDARKRAGI